MKKLSFLLSVILIPFILSGCRDSSVESDYSLSDLDINYNKLSDQNWEIFLSNLKGSKCKNVSNSLYEDSDNTWSADGKYIAYTHVDKSKGSTQVDIYVYDIENNTTINLTPEADYEASSPIWTPDSKKIIFKYHKIPESVCTYIMNIDGSGKRKLMDEVLQKIFFCSNGDEFLFVPAWQNITWEKLYKANLESTSCDLLVESKDIGKYYATFFDYNPKSNKMLVLISNDPQKPNFIAAYDLNNNELDTLILPTDGYSLTLPRYAPSYNKIAYVETRNDNQINKLCIYTYNEKLIRIVAELTGSKELFYHIPPVFSPNEKYIAYVKNTIQSGPWYYWKPCLYVKDLLTNDLWVFDSADHPVWNPEFSR
ncbi:MAG: hypothetical protein ACM34K_08530 [Bacillota bacterium]